MNPDLGNGPGIASSALQEPGPFPLISVPKLWVCAFFVWVSNGAPPLKKNLRRMYVFYYMLLIFEAMGEKKKSISEVDFFLRPGTNKLGVFLPAVGRSKHHSRVAVKFKRKA